MVKASLILLATVIISQKALAQWYQPANCQPSEGRELITGISTPQNIFDKRIGQFGGATILTSFGAAYDINYLPVSRVQETRISNAAEGTLASQCIDLIQHYRFDSSRSVEIRGCAELVTRGGGEGYCITYPISPNPTYYYAPPGGRYIGKGTYCFEPEPEVTELRYNRVVSCVLH